MSLALVTDNTNIEDEPDYLIESDAANATPYTADEKAIYKAFVKYLKNKGMCKIDDASSKDTRLFNRFDKKVQSMSYIENRFQNWIRENKKACRMPKTSYITRTLAHVVGSQFVPNGGDYWTDSVTDYTYANTFRVYRPVTTCTELDPRFMKFFVRLVPDAYERHLFLQWLSHIFQRPGERPSWHIMLTSDAGTGKGFLLEKILHPLLHHTQVIASYARITGQFSTVLADNLFVLLDDCKSKSEATQTALKSFMSEERVFVEHKHQTGGMTKTYTRFLLASNEQIPLAFDKDERRWVPLTRAFHEVNRETTQAHIKELSDWMDLPGSLDAVHNFFMTYDLDGFNPKCPPQTATMREMVSKGKGIHADLLADFILDNEVFTTSEWMAEYERQSLPKLRDAKAIPALLLEAGYEKSRPTVHGERETLCYPLGWTPQQIEEVYPKKVDPSCTKPPF